MRRCRIWILELGDLRELQRLIGEVFVDEVAAREWLHTPVPALDDRTPLALLREGNARAVIEVLATFHSGAFM